jgi:hypothetical protein
VNKRKRKQQQKVSTPLIILLIGGALLVIGAAVFFAFGNAASDGGGTPKLVVDQDKIDFGYVKFGNNKAFSIKVTNAGDGLLRFKEKPVVEVLVGC